MLSKNKALTTASREERDGPKDNTFVLLKRFREKISEYDLSSLKILYMNG